MSRRQILGAGLAAAAAGLAPGVMSQEASRTAARKAPAVVVVGSGAFGGWTALHLVRAGARVTLLDAWGPGNSRASSGGDTRVLRHCYKDRIYTDMAARALALWRENEKRWSIPLFRETGVLWMVQQDETYEKAALAHLEAAGVAHEVLSAGEIGRRYPQIATEGIRWGIHESRAGYLLARRSCAAVAEAVVSEGGTFRLARAGPGPIEAGELKGVVLGNGERLAADQYVFACGPWLSEALPAGRGELVRPSRQELFIFGAPAGDARFQEQGMPIWADHGERLWYGIPGSEGRGFKIADDTRGEPFDPTSGERVASADGLARARTYLARRFPGLKDAPLLESRVCQYENSPDAHFILDRHPAAANAWFLGGGSGHGFKHGPALGEMAAAAVLGRQPPEPLFSLARFAAA